MDTFRYSVESVIDGVGWILDKDKEDICTLLGDGTTIQHNKVASQLHLHWIVEADGMDEAIDRGRRTLRIAGAATHVFTPHPSHFSVREIVQ